MAQSTKQPKHEDEVSMIISNLVGGLGNQMFQYACTRSLATELNLPFKFTCDTFNLYSAYHNGLELDNVFAVDLQPASPEELRGLIGRARAFPIFRKALASNSLSALRGAHFVSEPTNVYWPGLLNSMKNGGYMQGYWQSERYFAKNATSIRQDFSFKFKTTGKNLELIAQIESCNSVSLHVRRGDYLSNAKTLSTHGVCSLDYYRKALEIVNERFHDARIFAFSDDPRWVTELLAPFCPSIVVVDHNRGENSYNDMRLMSHCKHHIVANSSFSWWGAWLNPRPDKLVIAPLKWYANGLDAHDLLPDSWIKV